MFPVHLPQECASDQDERTCATKSIAIWLPGQWCVPTRFLLDLEDRSRRLLAATRP